MIDRTANPGVWLALPALSFISYSVLTFEVSLTRIFSVILSYHFVFAIVSAALLGLGLGGMFLKSWQHALPASHSRFSATLFALLVAASILVIIYLPIYNSNALAGGGFWLYLLLATLPFLAAGLAISSMFQQFAGKGSLSYAADLLGATLGALTVVPLLDSLGGVNAVFFAAAAAGLGAVILGWSQVRFPVFAVVSFLALGSLVTVLATTGVQVPVPVGKDRKRRCTSSWPTLQ